MLSIHILTIGHKPPSWIQTGIEQYKKRLRGHYRMTYHALPAISAKLDAKTRSLKETASIQEKIAAGHYVIALDEQGQSMRTTDMAETLQQYQYSAQPVTFIIGPSDGLSTTIKKQADQIWSLSALTFTHDMAQLLLLEQIYRCACIQTNHPYHRT